MPRPFDLNGQTFGFLKVIGRTPRPEHLKDTAAFWLCECIYKNCGKQVIVRGCDLKRGHTRSCGCYRVDIHRETHTKHGQTRVGANRKVSKTYNTHQLMIRRCEKTQHPDYYLYGGRGIKVCDRWRNSFEAFHEDMGDPPSEKHSIDRIDSNGNYEPGNCRWATAIEQANNTRTARCYTYAGKTLSITRWAKELGIDRNTLTRRLNKGIPFEEAIKK